MKNSKIVLYLRSQSWHWYAAVAITLIGGFIRFYRIPQTVMFLGDQGRDALIVSRIFKEFDPVLIGPVTSVGNMYLGPLYYYFMLPFLWLSYPSPLGPVYAVAFFSSLTIFITYLVGKKMFSATTGLLASFFLAFGTASVELSRFSWNPNLAPLLSILMIYFCWKALRNSKYWIHSAVLFSALIQLHYLTLLTGVSAGVLWIYSLLKLKPTKKINKKKIQELIINSVLSGLVIIISFAPLVLFDVIHGGTNVNAFRSMFSQEKIFTHRQSSTATDKLKNLFIDSRSRSRVVLVDLMMGRQKSIEQFVIIFTAITLIYLGVGVKNKSEKVKDSLAVVVGFLLVGILGIAAYQHSIYNHYIAYLIPVVSICYALALKLIIKKLKIFSIPIIAVVLVGFLMINYTKWPLKPHNNYFNTQYISAQIEELIQPEDRYELVLLSETKDLYAQSYRYFLSTTSNPPVVRDKGEIPNTLIIIDEEKKVEDVTQLPIYEIQIFPEKEIFQKLENEELADIYILKINN
ncbi:MAG: hypothetical protein XD95_0004 [Microgenomates bacterium 39_7]|nr:MAG: hypothetical protein XD95_0004 [Microgenomates bacterium 39_7]